MVYKTVLLPQINYIASVLTPSKDTIVNLSTIMENFVCKGFNIAKNRLYMKPKEGGLGLFNLEIFINALQCTWIKRIINSCNDNWKIDLWLASDCNIEQIYRIDTENIVGSTLKNIVFSFKKFCVNFVSINQNFRKICIFENDSFGFGRNMQTKFDSEFFGPRSDI
jgi:hypothetical protein